jgi:hypothetical protein
MTAAEHFIQSPIRPFKRRRSFTELVDSPVKRRKADRRPEDLITPPQRGGKAPSPDFIAPRPQLPLVLPIKKRRIRKPEQYKKAPKEGQTARASPQAVVDDEGGFDDWRAFDDSSPSKAKDNIDWTISLEDVEKLKLELLPSYWEQLSLNLNSIIRVTERLYIVQEWHKGGRLKVCNCGTKADLLAKRIPTCLQDGRYHRSYGYLMRLP